MSVLDEMDHWVLDGHEPKRVALADWLAWVSAGPSRRVAEDTIGDAWVSTVFLSVDHGFGGRPILFETMIFGGQYENGCWRYGSWDAAEAGHRRVAEAMRGGRDPEAEA